MSVRLALVAVSGLAFAAGAALAPVATASPLAAEAPAAAAATPLRLAISDSGRAMALPVGTVLRVDLDANYSTGAEWQRRDAFGAVFESVPCEGIVREPLVKPGEPAPPVGTGTMASFCFRAAAPGRAFFYLFYGRAWDPESTAWSHFTLDVTVTPAG
ncbi:MAG TPA: protease inhibitor I42 family protein [Arenimonas sp.]|uniref:protease inhibitor I42 family protein n=1 Tax=Arenimonas sp. TaxID=1872635 RepID=UPI002D7FDC43|nr:protease inhibitor I42 family protein [Arenimonas sp.]HEU0153224.1 protease inhibitor I42 family protein [Arenimonas sp.]